jgi:hypothetical protein
LSHDALVGVKCSTKRGCAASQRWIAGVLCVEELSSTQMDVEIGRNLTVKGGKVVKNTSPRRTTGANAGAQA